MNSTKDLKAIYENGLKQKLTAFEKQRKSVVMFSLFPILALVLSVLTVVLIFTLMGRDIITKNQAGIGTIFVFVFFFSFFWLMGLAQRRRAKYAAVYKKEVVSRIISTIDPEWMYIQDSCICEKDYAKSGLFNRAVDIYSGDDLVMGKVGKTSFESSELHTQYTTQSTDSDGDTHTERHGIFKGFFFQSVFNKHFQGQTVVIHGELEEVADAFHGFKGKHKGKQKFVKLENPEFDKLFTVQSTDQIEARYILTPGLMQALVNIQKKHNNSMRVSFLEDKVYLTISFRKDLFEPRVWKSGTDFSTVEEIWDLFMLNADIINELDLNTRIWTKK